MLSPVKSLLIMVLLFISISSVFSQSVVWKEGFMLVEKNQDSTLWTGKGQWSLTSLGTNGSLSNTWHIGINEVNTGVGNCGNVPYIIDVATTLDSINVGILSDSTRTGGNSIGSSVNVTGADSIKVGTLSDSTHIGGNSTGSSGNGTSGGSTLGNLVATGIDTTKVVGNNFTIDDSPVLFLGLNDQNTNSKYFPGAFFSNDVSTETNWRIESPVISLSNKIDIKISFDYLLGVLNNQTQFIVSYYDGSSWIDLPALPNTFSGTCPAPKTSNWATSQLLSLPASVNNLENFKIAFSFVSTSAASNTINPSAKPRANKGSVKSARLPNFSSNSNDVNPQVSVAIDNIIVLGSTSTSAYVDPNNNANRTASTSKIDIKTVSDKKNNPKIVFTTYNEKFPANDLIIESSTDGTNFDELSKIKSSAVKGSVGKLEYNFTDSKANDGVNYYRIKQVNADKTMVVSEIVSVDHIKAKNITFTVYPNPNSGQFTVDFSGIENNHEVQIVLNDMNDGHEIYSTTFSSNSIESNKMDVNPPTKIAPGRYLCSLIFEGIRSSVIVMIN